MKKSKSLPDGLLARVTLFTGRTDGSAASDTVPNGFADGLKDSDRDGMILPGVEAPGDSAAADKMMGAANWRFPLWCDILQEKSAAEWYNGRMPIARRRSSHVPKSGTAARYLRP